MRLDQLFIKEDDTTVKAMSMPEKVAAFDRLKPGQEIGLWFDSVIRRADKYKPFVVGRKTRSKLRPLEKITLLQKSKDGGTGGMKYYLYKRNDDNVSLAMGDMAASLVDIQESNIVEATETIMERIVLDIDYSRNPEALMKAINVMGKRLDLTLMNAPQAIKDLKEKGFARIEGKDADIMSFVNYLYSKGIEPNYDIQNMDKVQTPDLNANPNMPAFIGKKKEPATEGNAWNKYGLTAKHEGGKFISYRNGKKTGEFDSMEELSKHQHDLIKDESVEEGHSNARHQAQTMLKLEELRDMIMVLDMEDDLKTSALTSLDQVADDISITESLTEEQFDEKAGEKDACYHKVKSRYKVWPSAYASGALSKCRKVGASNWGNSKKK